MATALTPYQVIESKLSLPETMSSLKSMLPSHISVEKFKRTALVALQKTPALVERDKASLYMAINACAQDGLLPDGREAALVPFGDKVQYLPMIAGVLKKVRQSGELLTIMAATIHAKDKFDYHVDEQGEHFSHKPDMLTDRGALVGAYAMAVTKDGGRYLEVMSKAQIEKVRNVSRAKNSGPWVDWYEEQAEKTVLRRLCKRLPMSTDIVERGEEEEYDFEKPAQVESQGQPEAPKAGSNTRTVVLDAVAKNQAELVKDMPKPAQRAPEPEAPVGAGDELPL